MRKLMNMAAACVIALVAAGCSSGPHPKAGFSTVERDGNHLSVADFARKR